MHNIVETVTTQEGTEYTKAGIDAAGSAMRLTTFQGDKATGEFEVTAAPFRTLIGRKALLVTVRSTSSEQSHEARLKPGQAETIWPSDSLPDGLVVEYLISDTGSMLAVRGHNKDQSVVAPNPNRVQATAETMSSREAFENEWAFLTDRTLPSHLGWSAYSLAHRALYRTENTES